MPDGGSSAFGALALLQGRNTLAGVLGVPAAATLPWLQQDLFPKLVPDQVLQSHIYHLVTDVWSGCETGSFYQH